MDVEADIETTVATTFCPESLKNTEDVRSPGDELTRRAQGRRQREVVRAHERYASSLQLVLCHEREELRVELGQFERAYVGSATVT